MIKLLKELKELANQLKNITIAIKETNKKIEILKSNKGFELLIQEEIENLNNLTNKREKLISELIDKINIL